MHGCYTIKDIVQTATAHNIYLSNDEVNEVLAGNYSALHTL